jgi:hypothetical protein
MTLPTIMALGLTTNWLTETTPLAARKSNCRMAGSRLMRGHGSNCASLAHALLILSFTLQIALNARW